MSQFSYDPVMRHCHLGPIKESLVVRVVGLLDSAVSKLAIFSLGLWVLLVQNETPRVFFLHADLCGGEGSHDHCGVGLALS